MVLDFTRRVSVTLHLQACDVGSRHNSYLVVLFIQRVYSSSSRISPLLACCTVCRSLLVDEGSARSSRGKRAMRHRRWYDLTNRWGPRGAPAHILSLRNVLSLPLPPA